jgi:hypothetical protein
MAKKREPRGKLQRHGIRRTVSMVKFCRNIKRYRLIFEECGHISFRSDTSYPPKQLDCQRCMSLSKGSAEATGRTFEYWNYDTGLPVREHYSSHELAVAAMHVYLQKQLLQRKD